MANYAEGTLLTCGHEGCGCRIRVEVACHCSGAGDDVLMGPRRLDREVAVGTRQVQRLDVAVEDPRRRRGAAAEAPTATV